MKNLNQAKKQIGNHNHLKERKNKPPKKKKQKQKQSNSIQPGSTTSGITQKKWKMIAKAKRQIKRMTNTTKSGWEHEKITKERGYLWPPIS